MRLPRPNYGLAMTAIVDKLEEILTSRRGYVARAKEKTSLAALESQAKRTAEPVSFLKAVHQPGRITLIAEFKRKSPSAGIIFVDADVAAVAQQYEDGGAAAMSILTEPDWFDGDIDDIRTAKTVTTLPVLRKDFVFDPYQIVEARAAGASAVLLIADMVSASELNSLVACAREWKLEPLVEAFTPEAMEATVASGAKVIGINTRNLRTLQMFPDHVKELSKMVPADRVLVAESGIKSAADVAKLMVTRASSMLVGESILKQPNLEEAVRALATAGMP